MGNNDLNIKYWRNPYIVLLLLVVLDVIFFEVAPLFQKRIVFLHSALFNSLMINANVAAASFGAVILYLSLIRHSRLELWLVLTCGAVLDTYLILQRLNYLTVDGQVFYIGVGYFPFILTALLWRWWQAWHKGEREKAVIFVEVFALCAAMPLIYICSGLVNSHDPYVYDSMLFAADSVFGTQVSFWVTRFVYSAELLRGINYFFYFYLAMFMLLAQLICYKRTRDKAAKKIQPAVVPAWLYIAVGLLGALCYRFFPAIGTEAFFGTGTFPNGPIPELTFIPRVLEGPANYARNAMPSLHLSWILCAYFSVCRLRKLYNYLGAFIVLCVLISAFAVGKHWLTDFIVALPFTAMCLGIASVGAPWKRRVWSVCIGGFSCFGLMCLYKYNVMWAVGNKIEYLLFVGIIDIMSWCLCLSLLPKSIDSPIRQED